MSSFDLYEDYIKWVECKLKLLEFESDIRDYFMLHQYEIETNIDDYEDIKNDKEKCEKLFEHHPTLKTYIILKMMQEHYLSAYNKYQVSSQFDNLGKCVLIKFRKSLTIYDTDNDKTYNIESEDKKFLRYIYMGLVNSDRFIAYINPGEIDLIKVVSQEVKHDLPSLNDKEICKKISDEVIIARMFDNLYIMYSSENKVYNINDELQNILILFKNNQLDKEEYFTRMYYYLILSNQDLNKLYLEADDEHKKYIINAYIRLSQLNSDIHIRTTSDIINKAVLERRKKYEANQ
jgi:hypothetical protein